MCGGQAGDAGACRWEGDWDISMGENHRAAAPRPPSRPVALTPAPFAGPLATSDHHVAASGGWIPIQVKLGCSLGRCRVHTHWPSVQLPRLSGHSFLPEAPGKPNPQTRTPGALQMLAQVDWLMVEGDGREVETGRPPRYSPTGRYTPRMQSYGKS